MAAAAAEKQRLAALTPEQRAEEKQRKQAQAQAAAKKAADEAAQKEAVARAAQGKHDREQQRGARVVGAGVVLRESLRNPDSVVWESIRANDDASIICFEYRAQNGFGGMNREFMAFINNKPSRSVQIWNKNCIQPLGGVAYAEEMIKALSRK